jgi:hypothetical protein
VVPETGASECTTCSFFATAKARHPCYSAVNLSAFDLLAPLAEIAKRSTGAHFDGSGKLAANLSAPRIDIEGGIPALSTHLLVGGGASFRMAAPRLTMPGTATSPPDYEYRSCLHSARGDCFEFDLFVKFSICEFLVVVTDDYFYV